MHRPGYVRALVPEQPGAYERAAQPSWPVGSVAGYRVAARLARSLRWGQVGAFVLVQLEGLGDRGEDVFGHATDVALLQARVPLGAHPREHGDFFTPQTRHPAPAAGGQPGLLRGDLRAAAGEKVPDLGAVVASVIHASHGSHLLARREVELVPPMNATFLKGGATGSLGDVPRSRPPRR